MNHDVEAKIKFREAVLDGIKDLQKALEAELKAVDEQAQKTSIVFEDLYGPLVQDDAACSKFKDFKPISEDWKETAVVSNLQWVFFNAIHLTPKTDVQEQVERL